MPAFLLRSLLLLLSVLGLGAVMDQDEKYSHAAANAFRLGDYDKAVELYEKSLASVLKVFKEDDMQVTEIRAELGEAYRADGRWNDAITQLDYVWKRSRFDAEDKHDWDGRRGEMAFGYAEKLGKACLGASRYEDGTMVFKTAEADAERSGRTESAMQFAALLAESQFLAKHPEDAAATVRHAAELSSKMAIDPAKEAHAISELAALCLRQRRPESAKPLAERALALALKVLPAENTTVARYQQGLAQVLLITDDLDGAAEHLQAARAGILNDESPDSPRMISLLLDESTLALKHNQPQDALIKAQQGLALAKRRVDATDPLNGCALAQIARAQVALSQPEIAQTYFSQALTILEGSLGADDVQSREVREELIKLGPRLSPAKSSAARAPKK